MFPRRLAEKIKKKISTLLLLNYRRQSEKNKKKVFLVLVAIEKKMDVSFVGSRGRRKKKPLTLRRKAPRRSDLTGTGGPGHSGCWFW
jgi:hypothetical protein